ncbi:MAG: J domain-containing protein [Desulfovibrionaceae bacterium]|jgi:molecular chaperone DnaJ|nr:J domain-containing protein [Desulfovibrionaceae bacterium]
MNLDEAYSTLRLTRAATLEEVKRSYRTLAFELHPDLNPGDPNAGRRFQLVNEAYVLLKRQVRTGPLAGPAGGAGGSSGSPGAAGSPWGGERMWTADGNARKEASGTAAGGKAAGGADSARGTTGGARRARADRGARGGRAKGGSFWSSFMSGGRKTAGSASSGPVSSGASTGSRPASGSTGAGAGAATVSGNGFSSSSASSASASSSTSGAGAAGHAAASSASGAGAAAGPTMASMAGPGRNGFYYEKEEVLQDILKDPFARQVFEDIYKQIRRDGRAVAGLFRPGRRRLSFQWGERTVTVDLSRGLVATFRRWLRRQMDDEQTIRLPIGSLRPGGRMRLQVTRGWSGRRVTLEVTLPPDFAPGRPIRLKGLGRHFGPWKGDLYLHLLAKAV